MLDQITGSEPTEPEDNYKGSTGWVIVAVGVNGCACLVDFDDKFGALRWMLDCGFSGSTPEEVGIEDVPEDAGIYRGQFKAWTTSVHDYDGSDNDMGFSLVGEWEDLEVQK